MPLIEGARSSSFPRVTSNSRIETTLVDRYPRRNSPNSSRKTREGGGRKEGEGALKGALTSFHRRSIPRIQEVEQLEEKLFWHRRGRTLFRIQGQRWPGMLTPGEHGTWIFFRVEREESPYKSSRRVTKKERRKERKGKEGRERRETTRRRQKRRSSNGGGNGRSSGSSSSNTSCSGRRRRRRGRKKGARQSAARSLASPHDPPSFLPFSLLLLYPTLLFVALSRISPAMVPETDE